MAARINAEKHKDIISEIWIDDREGSRKSFAMEQYAPLNPSIKHLEIGDYIFKGHNGIDVCIEYKEGADFLNSINSEDNHLHNQVYEMITSFDYTFIMVQCEDMINEIDHLYYVSGISMSLPQVNGAITEYNTVSTVLSAQTRYQAFDMMVRQASKIIQQKPFRYKYGKKTTNQALNWLSAMKGLDNKAEDICRTLDIHTLSDLQNLTVERLTEVEGIGKKTAAKILQNICGE